MQISIQFSGKRQVIPADLSQTVRDLKSLLASLFSIPKEQQCLSFKGVTLSDESKLSDYKIQADAVILLEVTLSLREVCAHALV